ncbi:periplasmic protein [Rubripirellula lacrimiformis]|uniref:Periplasmic protein n=1 Tax=Rubripirellula lacrimiformis TaxID=1930273 RepID=A0A517N769_9BACT|nr:BON domain-containing protein [Rubripirellula lacrimiformis]QDT02986.1 periplasmic protein [Rubripirellula lacrimiformis]
MRRKYFGLAIAALATLGPMQAWGGDREIAEQIIQRLKTSRDSGALKDFTLDMKVDDGVVVFKGNVSESAQKDLVLGAAAGIEGIANIVDEVRVSNAQPVATAAPEATVLKPQAAVSTVGQSELTPTTVESASDFSFRNALAAQARAIEPMNGMPGEVRPASALEPVSDDAVVNAVVAALGRAKDAGQLKGFGVDVKSNNGVLQLTGRASSEEQRTAILGIAESVPGVSGIREAITVGSPAPSGLARLPQAPALSNVAPQMHAAAPMGGVPAQYASAPMNQAPQAMTAPYRMQQGQMPMQAQASGMHMQHRGNPMMGQPVPMGPSAPAGAPRYDSPNLPNYAWPGYAAAPNYAAVTYPQQYSPSAWPYIGPFYPYPQVPLGWRKVSLEWDDGWWFLDFTDR